MARSRRQKEVASVDAYRKEDVDLVVTLLEENPDIDILWGGSNMATDISIKAVERLGRQDSVAVFGILDLSAYTAKKLLDSESPLQSVIDQAGALGNRLRKGLMPLCAGTRQSVETFLTMNSFL